MEGMEAPVKRIGTILVVGLVAVLAGCSTVLYQGHGQYADPDGKSGAILLEWKAQKYYFPFVDADVDYGSVSLQAECKPDIFLDDKEHAEHGLVFVERPQDYRLVPGAPDIRIGNFLVCAKLKGGQSLEQAGRTERIDLQVLCEAKSGLETLPANLDGYGLAVAEARTERTLLCPAND